jgi:YXWGXW repeat-containing protein
MLNLVRARSILVACALGIAPSLFAQSISITIAPPPLPVYEQPLCPGDGYYWIPGYWAYGDDGYFWVPGAWVEVPEPGFLWTPGYWDYAEGAYSWHTGYWCRHIGFYGGVNYGFGYYGSGFYGGRWDGRVFHYNTAVWRVNPSLVHDTYADPSVINGTVINNHTSFNGPGGIDARPTAEEAAAEHDRHIQSTDRQRAHEQEARHDPNQRYSVNHGQPNKAAQTSAVEHREGEHPGGEHHKAAHQEEHHEAAHHEAAHREGGTHHEEHHPAQSHSQPHQEKRSGGGEKKTKG